MKGDEGRKEDKGKWGKRKGIKGRRRGGLGEEWEGRRG